MKNKIKYLFASLFIFLYNTLVWAQMEGDEDEIIPPPDRDGETPGGPAKVSIDMYEGTLLVIAILLIVGYYLYKRNKRIA